MTATCIRTLFEPTASVTPSLSWAIKNRVGGGSRVHDMLTRDFVAKNPMDDWTWEAEDRKAPRILSTDEETATLGAAGALYGYRLWNLVLRKTGARRGELLGLSWDRV